MGSGLMKSLRGYANGTMTESAIQAATITDDDIAEYENDPQFMQEATAACLPTMIQMMILEDSSEALDESVQSAVATIRDYLIGQGVLTEAASVSIKNPKINIVRMNKNAQIARLKAILTLKMGRKADHKAYKKYKLGQKIKMDNRAELDKLYGQKAERLAKKLWAKLHKSAKVAAVVDKEKSNAKK